MTIGADGRRLLQAVEGATALPWLWEIPAGKTPQQVWAEQYTDPPGPLRWRAVNERASAAEVIASPYDLEARYSTKREVQWVGYKVHLTETCDDDQPHLITQVMTTPATTPDCVMGPTIHHHLAQRDLLPSTHLLDGGYVDAELLVTAQTEHQIDVVGPTFGSYSRQRLAGQGYNLYASDTLPCRVCPARRACTWAKNAPRQLTVRPQAQHEAIQLHVRARRPPVPNPVCRTGWGRGHTCAGHPVLRPAQVPVRRVGEDPFVACDHGGGPQRSPVRRVVAGHAPGQKPAFLPLPPCRRQPHRVGSSMNSPPVSVLS